MMLLTAIGVAGAAWYWNRLVHSPDPRIMIRTEGEAIEGARKFLAAAHISMSGYDLSQASGITKDRLKGQRIWRISWLPKQDAMLTNNLVVVASETGWFYTHQMSSTNEGISIEGDLTNITREPFRLE